MVLWIPHSKLKGPDPQGFWHPWALIWDQEVRTLVQRCGPHRKCYTNRDTLIHPTFLGFVPQFSQNSLNLCLFSGVIINNHLLSPYHFKWLLVWALNYMVSLRCQCDSLRGSISISHTLFTFCNNMGFDIESSYLTPSLLWTSFEALLLSFPACGQSGS